MTDTHQNASFAIVVGDLWVPVYTPEHRLRNLALADAPPGSHIHGDFQIRIGGRTVPGMDYWNYDGLTRDGGCFPEWIGHLSALTASLRSPQGYCRFTDYLSMESPIYEFLRDGDTAYFSQSIAAGGKWVMPDPEWEMVPFAPADLGQAFRRFKAEFLGQVQAAWPGSPSALEPLEALFRQGDQGAEYL